MQEFICRFINTLKIADPQTISDIIVARKLADWTSGHSARVQAQKHLNSLADLKRITKHPGFYRSLDCQSEYNAHARLLTYALAEILKSPYDPIVYREHSLPNGLRPDALVLLQREDKALCFVLEVCHTETYDYLKGKYDEWIRWRDKRAYLTQLFRREIRYCAFVVSGKEAGFATPFEEVLRCVSSS
jgi:hypothetical protein